MIQHQIIDITTQPSSKWSGGSTSELVIWPETASYQQRDFSFRLSTAQVEQEESTFTLLPGVERHILSLEGRLRLSHDDGQWITLETCQPHIFPGGVRTTSRGKLRDLNLMLAEGRAVGWMRPLTPDPKSGIGLGITSHAGFSHAERLLLAARGPAKVSWFGGEADLAENQLLRLYGDEQLPAVWVGSEDFLFGVVIEIAVFCDPIYSSTIEK